MSKPDPRTLLLADPPLLQRYRRPHQLRLRRVQETGVNFIVDLLEPVENLRILLLVAANVRLVALNAPKYVLASLPTSSQHLLRLSNSRSPNHAISTQVFV